MKKETNPLRLIIIFLVLVLTLAVVSLSYKVFVQIQESRYIFETYNLLVIDRDAYIIHLDNEEKRMVSVRFPYAREEFINRSKLSSSILSGVLIDAVLISNDQLGFGEKGITLGTVVDTLTAGKKYRLIGMNNYDLLRAAMSIGSIDDQSKQAIEKELPEKEEGDLLRQAVFADELGQDIFRDREVFNEKISIEVVNATGINGLGTMLSNLMIAEGFNVVSVESMESQTSTIRIRSDEVRKTSSFKRIYNAFEGISIGLDDSLIADISIVIGEDLTSTFEEE